MHHDSPHGVMIMFFFEMTYVQVPSENGTGENGKRMEANPDRIRQPDNR